MRSWWSRPQAPVMLASGVVVVALAVVALILRFARSDIWMVAVPGYLTGIGTLALAGLTVTLAVQDRRRDDYLRAEQELRLSQQREQFNQESALREARRVVAVAPNAVTALRSGYDPGSYDGIIRVVNGGADPILDVTVEGAVLKLSTARPSAFTFSMPIAPWLRVVDVIVGGEVADFKGKWMPPANDDYDLYRTKGVLMGFPAGTIAWTDSRGTRWRRTSSDEPVSLGPAHPLTHEFTE